MTLTVERVRELLEYDAETGTFRWRLSKRKGCAGKVAGTACHDYWSVRIDLKAYGAHRLAWFYVHGVWPEPTVDHINRDKRDNRLCNLREATQSENNYNTPIRQNNTSGATGVFFDSQSGKYKARHNVDGKQVHVGYFDDFDAAVKARDISIEKHMGRFACLSRAA